MKDAQGHGSDARGALDSAITNFQAAHQAGVNAMAPSQSGQQLYDAAMAAAHPSPAYDEKTLRDIEPDFDEMPGVGQNPYYPRSRVS